jgi:hypothetical protein
MKKLFMLLAVIIVFAQFGCASTQKKKESEQENKIIFAYFSGYRCPPCMKFESEFLKDFEKTYKEKYNGRVELKIYKTDIPLHITKDSPEYIEAKKLADRNDAILRATGKLHGLKWIGSLPYAVIGGTSLDGSTDELEPDNGKNIEWAIEKALKNNEHTQIADKLSGKMNDYSGIIEASRAGDYKAVKEFIQNGADANEDNGEALFIAAFNGDINVAKLLISHGANINAKNKYDSTPISMAAFLGGLEMVEFLLSNGADINIPKNVIVDAGIDENMIILLKKHGADINAAIPDGHTPLTNVIVNREKLSGTKIAIRYAEVLIRQDADVNAKVTIKDDDGKIVTKTALELARSQEMKDFLISRGAK